MEATAKNIRGTSGRPVRVSLAAIAREVGHKPWLEHRLNKLPLTSKALKNCLESVDEFLIRRVRWAEEWYYERGICPARSYFKVRAGVQNKTGDMPDVQKTVDAAMERLSRRLDGVAAMSSQLNARES